MGREGGGARKGGGQGPEPWEGFWGESPGKSTEEREREREREMQRERERADIGRTERTAQTERGHSGLLQRPGGGGSYSTGALTEKKMGEIFGGSTGKSCSSPGAIT